MILAHGPTRYFHIDCWDFYRCQFYEFEALFFPIEHSYAHFSLCSRGLNGCILIKDGAKRRRNQPDHFTLFAQRQMPF